MTTTTTPPIRHRSRNPFVAFAIGFTLPLRAATFLLERRGIKRWAVLPLIANIVLFSLIGIGLFLYVFHLEFDIPEWQFWGGFGAWLSSALEWMTGPLKWLIAIPLFILFWFFGFTTIGMVIASPFNDMLSERVERALCDPKASLDVPLRLTAANAVVGALDSLKIVGMQIVAMVLALFFLPIPIIGFLPLFIVIAYFTGLGFFDVSMARNDLRYRHKKAMFGELKWQVFGLGVAMELCFLIPFAGLVLLPLGVTAGTMLYCRQEWLAYFGRHGIEPPTTYQPPQILGTATAEEPALPA